MVETFKMTMNAMLANANADVTNYVAHSIAASNRNVANMKALTSGLEQQVFEILQ
jgi:hypothetical protein